MVTQTRMAKKVSCDSHVTVTRSHEEYLRKTATDTANPMITMFAGMVVPMMTRVRV